MITQAAHRIAESALYNAEDARYCLEGLIEMYIADDKVAEARAQVDELIPKLKFGGEPSGPWINLYEAFEDLNANGILSRMNLGGTVSEGAGLIDEEVEKAEAEGKKISGSVYFHNQDTDRAYVEGRILLAFAISNSIKEGFDEKQIALGHAIVNILKKHELTTTWSGDPKRRIQVMLYPPGEA